MSGDMVCPHKAGGSSATALEGITAGLLCLCEPDCGVVAGATGCPGWCEQKLGKHKFLDPELTRWALQEVSVSPEGRALHCSVANELVERPTVGWDGAMLPFLSSSPVGEWSISNPHPSVSP